MITGKDSRHQITPVIEKQFESLVRAASDAILGIDHQGKIAIWNDVATKMFGHSAKHAIGMDLRDLIIPGRMHAKTTEGFTAFVKTGKGPLVGKVTECIALRKGGSEFPVELSISSFKQDGHWHAVGIVRDISKHTQAEQRLKQREYQHEAISKLGQYALTDLELDALFQKTTALIAETLEVEYCKVLELQPSDKVLLLRAGTGWKKGLAGHTTVGLGLDSQAGYTLKSDHAVIVSDVRTETRFSAPPLLRDHGVISGISVIIQGSKQPWGILGAHTKEHREFSEDDVNFIQSAANVLALAIGRKRYEEKLHQFKHIVSTSSDMIALLDRDFIYLAANPAYLDAFDKTPGEVIGHAVSELFGEAFFNTTIKPYAKSCLTEKEINYQKWFDFPAYEPRYMDIHYYPYFDIGNEVIGFVVNGRDITKYKQVEDTLRGSEIKYRTLFESTADAIVLLDDKVIFDCNEAALRIFGCKSRDQFLNKQPSELSPPMQPCGSDSKRLADQHIATAFRQGKNQFEWMHRRIDGTDFPTEIWLTTMALNGKKILQATVRDITKRVQAQEALEKSHEQLRKSLICAIVAVSRAVGARDPYTAEHQQRVSRLSRAIGQEMGLDRERIDGLRMGASIHDIGKIHLPAEILSKPSKLSDIEYAFIKTHAQVGYDILKDIAFPWPVADIAWQHHERLDGSGYPQGLKGDEICLEARIVAVADVVEAMSNHRPYREALGIDAALKEIEVHRGTWFEPAAVDACLKLFREKDFSFDWSFTPPNCLH